MQEVIDDASNRNKGKLCNSLLENTQHAYSSNGKGKSFDFDETYTAALLNADALDKKVCYSIHCFFLHLRKLYVLEMNIPVSVTLILTWLA